MFISKNSKLISDNINLKCDTAKCSSVTHTPPSTLATNRCIYQSLSQSIHLSTSSHSSTHHLEFILPFITLSAACDVSSLLHFIPPSASICQEKDSDETLFLFTVLANELYMILNDCLYNFFSFFLVNLVQWLKNVWISCLCKSHCYSERVFCLWLVLQCRCVLIGLVHCSAVARVFWMVLGWF